MHEHAEIRVDKDTEFKSDEVEFRVDGIYRKENGKLIAHVHIPKTSALWESLGYTFVFYPGDVFKAGHFMYMVSKIVERDESVKGGENSHICLKRTPHL